MSKMKTKSAAKKRLKKLKSGKIKRAQSYKRHLLTKKNAKRKLKLRKRTYVSKSDQRNAVRLLPY